MRGCEFEIIFTGVAASNEKTLSYMQAESFCRVSAMALATATSVLRVRYKILKSASIPLQVHQQYPCCVEQQISAEQLWLQVSCADLAF